MEKRKKITPLVAARRLLLSERRRYQKGLSDWKRIRWLEGMVEAIEGEVSKTVKQPKV